MKKHGKKNRHGTLRLLLLAVYSVLLVKHSEQIADGVRGALVRCLDVMIPSLFAFLAAADMLVRGGAYITLSRPLLPLSRLMGLPDDLGAVFLISNAAGYPTGAAAITALHASGRLGGADASRLLCFCCNGGPAFFAGAVGAAVFGSARTGLVVWLTVLAANILTGAVLCRIFPIKLKAPAAESSDVPAGSLLTEGVAAAGRSMAGICGMILLFSTFLTLAREYLSRLGLGEGVERALAAFLEVSELSALRGSFVRLFPVVCAAGAFGGVCVILQISAIVGGRFSLLPFVCARAVCACVCAAAALPISRLLAEEAVPAAVSTMPAVSADRLFPSLCLAAMIVLTLASVKRTGGDLS